jgi:hypothetical protein
MALTNSISWPVARGPWPVSSAPEHTERTANREIAFNIRQPIWSNNAFMWCAFSQERLGDIQTRSLPQLWVTEGRSRCLGLYQTWPNRGSRYARGSKPLVLLTETDGSITRNVPHGSSVCFATHVINMASNGAIINQEPKRVYKEATVV